MAEAVSILPTEIWELILFHVQEEPNDTLSCYQTCKLWHSSLQKSRTTWLFPFIYPYLHNQLKLNLKDVMSCRLVCQSWAKGVDAFMESHHFYPISSQNPSWLTTQRLWSVHPNHLLSSKNRLCETFMEDFKDSTRNPFISRTLKFTTYLQTSAESIKFLKVFGRHLRSLELDFMNIGRHRSATELLKYVWDILDCVPFLEHLQLSGLTREGDEFEWIKESDECVQKFAESLKPPNLPNLVSLDMVFVSIRQLKKVFIQHFQSSEMTILYDFDSLVPLWARKSHIGLAWNMRELYFNWDKDAAYCHSQVQALSHINLPLESIKIRVQCFPNLDQFFHQVLRFKANLLSLTLLLEKIRSERVELPANRENGGWPTYAKYFGYISQLKKLKRLEIWTPKIETGNPDDTQVGSLAHSVLMEHWSDYRLAGEGGRQIEIKTFPNLGVRIIVNFLKKHTRRPINGYYPLEVEDDDRRQDRILID